MRIHWLGIEYAWGWDGMASATAQQKQRAARDHRNNTGTSKSIATHDSPIPSFAKDWWKQMVHMNTMNGTALTEAPGHAVR